MLKINVTTAEAVITETELITSGRKGLKCAFTFNSAWDGLAKTVIVQGAATRDIALLATNEITVPAECVNKAQFPLKIGVYGARPDGSIAIPTIWASFGKILPGVKPSDIPPDELTPDVVAQIQEAANNALYLARNVQSMADSGALDGEDGATFTPSVSSEGVISWTNDKGLPNPAPVNIKGETGAPGVPGDDYVLTDEDRADIALDVAETVLEPATVSGNPLVISDGVGGTRPLSLLCEVEAAEAVTLTRTGKNIWDSARFLEADGWTLEEDGSFSGYNSDLYYSFGRSGKSLFGNTAWNEQVTVSFDLRKVESSTAENAIEIVLNYADGTKTSLQNRGSSTWQHCSVSSTLGKTIASIQFTYGSKAKIWLKNFQVEFSGVSTGYQPYAATVYQLPIPGAPASGTIDLTEAARDAVTMLEGANVVFADCMSLTMTYPVRPAGSGGSVTVDDALSGSSTNPVQNKVVKAALDGKGTYSKPSGGIPKSDLASAVQTSLGKADTALQSAPVTSVNGQTGAVTLSIPSTASDVGAVAVNQGSENAGKVLVVSGLGAVVPGIYNNQVIVNLTITGSDYSGTMDETPAQLSTAYFAGKHIIAYVPAINMRAELFSVETVSGGEYEFNFTAVGEFNSQDVIARFTTSSTTSTFTTKIYPLATGQWTGGSY